MGQKSCLGCGRDWTPKRSDAKTCSPACRQRLRRRLKPKSSRFVHLDDVPLHETEAWVSHGANAEEPFTNTGRVRDSGRKAEGKRHRLDSARPPKGTRLSGSDKVALGQVNELIAATTKAPPRIQTPPGGHGTVSVTTRERATPMTTAIRQVKDAVHAEGELTRKALREEMESLFQIAFSFRYGETPVEAWERFLAEK
jgi:hypothetical protein